MIGTIIPLMVPCTKLHVFGTNGSSLAAVFYPVKWVCIYLVALLTDSGWLALPARM